MPIIATTWLCLYENLYPGLDAENTVSSVFLIKYKIATERGSQNVWAPILVNLVLLAFDKILTATQPFDSFEWSKNQEIGYTNSDCFLALNCCQKWITSICKLDTSDTKCQTEFFLPRAKYSSLSTDLYSVQRPLCFLHYRCSKSSTHSRKWLHSIQT